MILVGWVVGEVIEEMHARENSKVRIRNFLESVSWCLVSVGVRKWGHEDVEIVRAYSRAAGLLFKSYPLCSSVINHSFALFYEMQKVYIGAYFTTIDPRCSLMLFILFKQYHACFLDRPFSRL